MFTADVAVEDQDEIAQHSSCMLAHGQGTFCRVVDFRVDTTASAVGMSRVPLKTTKTVLRIIWYHMLVSCCASPKNNKITTTRTRTRSYSSKNILGYSTGKIKSNPLEPHFQTSATMSRYVGRTKTTVALPHCSEST